MFFHYELAPFWQKVGGGGYTSFIFIQQETACDQISNANQNFWESEIEDERPGQKQPTLSSPVSWNWCQSSALFSFAAGCTNFTVNISFKKKLCARSEWHCAMCALCTFGELKASWSSALFTSGPSALVDFSLEVDTQCRVEGSCLMRQEQITTHCPLPASRWWYSSRLRWAQALLFRWS